MKKLPMAIMTLQLNPPEEWDDADYEAAIKEFERLKMAERTEEFLQRLLAECLQTQFVMVQRTDDVDKGDA
jgi:hypothetical protein